jgi:transcriptional coactivator HFI1/ADA1
LTDCVYLKDWEPEIRKRYAQPLFLESNEFPDPDSLPGRVLPICYEEGIFNGYAPQTIEYMNIATETHIKEFLTRIFASTRSNGPRSTWIKSAAYKKRQHREQDQFENGEIRKSVTGLLPVEQEAENNRRPLSMFDIRLNLDLGGSTLSTHTPRSMTIFEATGIDDEAATGDVEMIDAPPLLAGVMMAPPKPLTNGVLTNGIHKDVEMFDDYGWRGGNEPDRKALDDVLDDCLAGL